MATNLWRAVASCQEPGVQEHGKTSSVPQGQPGFQSVLDQAAFHGSTVLHNYFLDIPWSLHS